MLKLVMAITADFRRPALLFLFIFNDPNCRPLTEICGKRSIFCVYYAPCYERKSRNHGKVWTRSLGGSPTQVVFGCETLSKRI